MTLRDWFELVRTREEGQTMAEYAVTLSVITATTIGMFALLGDTIAEAVSPILSFF